MHRQAMLRQYGRNWAGTSLPAMLAGGVCMGAFVPTGS